LKFRDNRGKGRNQRNDQKDKEEEEEDVGGIWIHRLFFFLWLEGCERER
jgi:hypothetical protein